MKTTTLTLVLALAALAAPAAAGSADDDLAVVRKATASGSGQAAAVEAPPSRRAADHDPQWFRVRIVEKGKKNATVKVNLPLSLVHAFGDDIPIPGCDEQGRGHLTVGEVLKALDSGESLVEIEDDDATVRIWVE